MADTTNGDDKGKETGGKTRKSSYKLPEDAAGAKASSDDAAEADAEVIDLDAARGAEGGGLLDNAVGDSLRQSFRKFVVENVLPKDTKSGSVDLNIDANFLRQHGTQLLSSLVEGVAKAILPEAMEMNVALGKTKDAGKLSVTKTEGKGGADDAGDEPDVNVNVNFDAMTFLRSLLAPVPAEATPAAKVDASDDDELDD